MHKIIEIFADRAALHTEILALRQQVAVLKRKRPRPLLRKADRVFWVILSCLWPGWRHALVIVRPETVIGWLSLPFIPSIAETLEFCITTGYPFRHA